MARLDVTIDKMHCGACIRRVTQTLNSLPGTHAESVALGTARLTTDGAPDAVLQALDAAGFPARLGPAQP